MARRRLPSAWLLPSMMASPPSSCARSALICTPLWLASMRPRALASKGRSGRSLRSLPGSCRLALSWASALWPSGTTRPSFSSAGPLAVLLSSTWPVALASGVLRTTRSRSASGPRAMPSTSSSVGSADSSRMRPDTSSSVRPHRLPRVRAKRMLLRSNTSSPEMLLNTGQGESQAGSGPRAGTEGTGARLTPCIWPAMRKSPSRLLTKGKSHRSPCTRKLTSRSSPARTARWVQCRVSRPMPSGR